jgi:pilus assembly protein CpaB
MRPSKKIIVLSVLMGILTVLAVYFYIQKEMAKIDKSTYASVVVAKRDIDTRTRITSEMLEKVKINEDYILPGSLKDESQIIGKYAIVKLVANEQIVAQRVVDLDKTNFSYKIPAGYVAITIPADDVSGVADLIKPGDFVDVFLYFEEKDSGDKVSISGSKDVLQRVLVLSVDKTSELTDSQGTEKSNAEERKITLSVSPKAGEKLVLAHKMGYIHLALRNPEDKGFKDTQGTVRRDILNR